MANRNYHHWQPDELEFLRANYPILSKAELANRLGVTNNAVISCAKKYGFAGDRSPAWTEEEDRVLRELYAGSPRDILPYLPNRTVNSVEYRVLVLGLQERRKARVWEEAEIRLLERLEGLPVTKIKQSLDRLCEERGWTKRSRAAIGWKIRSKLQGSAAAHDCLSIKQLAAVLHADERRLKRWAETHQAELCPMVTDKGVYLKLSRLARFVSRYPGEIARFKPDIVWLVGLVTGGKSETN